MTSATITAATKARRGTREFGDARPSFQRANGPTPTRKSTGAISGTNTHRNTAADRNLAQLSASISSG